MILAAAEVYRWVDEQGKAHISDRPPPNPPANMTREAMPDPDTNTHQGLSPDQRQQLELPARPLVGQPEPDRAPAPARAGADCDALWAAYQDSQACFERYRTSDAGIKPEAFNACGPEVRDPSPQCGPLR